jgi:hypothetical protein
MIAVGIAARQGAGWSGDLIPLGARFPASLQNGPGAHAPSYAMGTGFPGVKWPGRNVGHPPILAPRLNKE